MEKLGLSPFKPNPISQASPFTVPTEAFDMRKLLKDSAAFTRQGDRVSSLSEWSLREKLQEDATHEGRLIEHTNHMLKSMKKSFECFTVIHNTRKIFKSMDISRDVQIIAKRFVAASDQLERLTGADHTAELEFVTFKHHLRVSSSKASLLSKRPDQQAAVDANGSATESENEEIKSIPLGSGLECFRFCTPLEDLKRVERLRDHSETLKANLHQARMAYNVADDQLNQALEHVNPLYISVDQHFSLLMACIIEARDRAESIIKLLTGGQVLLAHFTVWQKSLHHLMESQIGRFKIGPLIWFYTISHNALTALAQGSKLIERIEELKKELGAISTQKDKIEARLKENETSFNPMIPQLYERMQEKRNTLRKSLCDSLMTLTDVRIRFEEELSGYIVPIEDLLNASVSLADILKPHLKSIPTSASSSP